MATLDPGNIVNGNTIETNDILQLYKAFGTGSGASITGLAMTGSLYGNALTSTTATTANTASRITTTITGGGTHYLAFVEGAGAYPTKIASALEYDALSNELNVTASYATSASYAPSVPPTYTNTALDNYTNPPGTDYNINATAKNILFVDTSQGPVGFNFLNGTEGQLIKFATSYSQPSIDLTNISITASGAPINFINNNSLPITPPLNTDTMNNQITTPGSVLWSFDFYYTSGQWFLITPFAQ